MSVRNANIENIKQVKRKLKSSHDSVRKAQLWEKSLLKNFVGLLARGEKVKIK